MNQGSQKTWIWLGSLVVLLQILLLFVAIPQISTRLMPLYNQDKDIDGYDQLATNLVQGHGYRFYPETASTMMREPGYPLFLAGILLTLGTSFTAVKVGNLCLALATAWLIMKIAAQVSQSQVVVIGAPLLFLFHPAILIAESREGVEILFTFLLTLFVFAFYRALSGKQWVRWVLAGFALGCAVLVKSTPLLFPSFVLGYFLLFERGRNSFGAALRNVGIMIAAMLFVLSPWIIRNFRLTKHFVPTASVLGVSAHAGQYICTHRSSGQSWVMLDRSAARERAHIAEELGYRFRDDFYYQTFYASQDELRFSSDLMKRVLGNYRESPWVCVRCMASNLVNFWIAGKTRTSTFMNVLVQLPYLLLAVTGMIWCVRKNQLRLIAPMILLILYVMGICMPILAQARYSVPVIPFVSILAGFGILSVFVKCSRSSGLPVLASAEPALVGGGRQ